MRNIQVLISKKSPPQGGLGIIIPNEISDSEFNLSKLATELLSDAIMSQQKDLPEGFEAKSKEAKKSISKMRRDQQAL